VRKLLVFLVVLAFVADISACAAYGRARLLYYLADTRITESSGVASYSRANDVLFTHNDSGDIARFFAVGPKGQTLATYTLVNGFTAIDWEDMARGPGRDGKPALFFGDIGDNAASRPFVTIYEVPEPEIDLSATSENFEIGVGAGSIRRMRYEDGPHDAETLFVHPKTRDIGIVSKVANGESGVYIAGKPDGSGIATLERVASISFKRIARPYRKTDFAQESRLQSTGGDVSPDGKRMVVRTYVEAFEWNIANGLADGFARRPSRIPLPRTRQGEAIGYTHDGRSIVTTTEQRPSPVHIVPSGS
jgi:hypothetical protein